MQCMQCKKTYSREQIVRLEWRKTKRYLDLCPKCYREKMFLDIKEDKTGQIEKLGKKKLVMGDSNDIKSQLAKWNKNLYDTY